MEFDLKILRKHSLSRFFYFSGLFLVNLTLWCAAAIEASAANNTKWDRKKIGVEARLGTAKWCGSDSQKIVWQGVSSGIHFSKISNGAVETITHSRTHTDPFCSPDGRFVFFIDESIGKIKAYDLNTSKITTVECLSNRVALSPDMRSAVSVDAGGCRTIELPWGEVIPVKRINVMKSIGSELPSVVAWFPSMQKIILSFVEPFKPGMLAQHISIAVYEFSNSKLTPIKLPHNPSRIKVSDNERHIFYLGENIRKHLNETPPPSNLFKVDIELMPIKTEQVGSNISAFDMHPRHGFALLNSKGEISVGMPDNKGIKSIYHQNTDGPVTFSPDGSKLLLMKQDTFHGKDGPTGPPITSAVYILFENNY